MYSREDTIKLLLSKKADPTTPGGVSGSNLTSCPVSRFRDRLFFYFCATLFSRRQLELCPMTNSIVWEAVFRLLKVVYNSNSQLVRFSDLFQPKNQSCVHLVCSRPTSQALQIVRALMTVAPKNTRVKPDTVRQFQLITDINNFLFMGNFEWNGGKLFRSLALILIFVKVQHSWAVV